MKKSIFLTMVILVSFLVIAPTSLAADITVSNESELIDALDDIGNGEVIYLEPGTYYVNLVIDNPGKSFALAAADGPGTVTLDGDDNGSVISINDTGTHCITLDGLTIYNGSAEYGGGIYSSYSSLVLSACKIDSNYAEEDGGGMYCYGCDVMLINCQFCDNEADEDCGGGFYNEECNVTATDCSFEYNYAYYYGGGACNEYSVVTYTNCYFYENDSEDYGGGMESEYSDVTVTSCTFENNESYYGGAMDIYETSAPARVSDCDFIDNLAFYYGGALHIEYSEALVSDCLFDENYAEDNGGALYNDESFVTAVMCYFDDNYSEDYGGAIYSYTSEVVSKTVVQECVFKDNGTYFDGGAMYSQYAVVEVTDCSFLYNDVQLYDGGALYNYYSEVTVCDSLFRGNESSNYDGGAMCNYGGTVSVSTCTFEDNNAGENGGAIDNYETAFALDSCVFANNESDEDGGALYIVDSAPVVTNSIFYGNYADDDGGAISLKRSDAVLTNCTFYDNEADDDGGALYCSSCSPTVTNCILWNNGEEIYNTSADPSVSYGDVDGGYTGVGNIDADPLFADPDNRNFSLLTESPCIDSGVDAGTDYYGNVTDDITGLFRPQGGQYDMGAYESRNSWSPVAMSPLARTQLGNVLASWEALSARLPSELSEEMVTLVAQIQAHMENAAVLANPIYASGQLSQAIVLMGQLSALL